MLRLKPSNVCPPDKYRYLFHDGHTEHGFSADDWRDKVGKYATDNGYAVPSVEEMEDQLCRTLSGEWCTGGDEYSFVSNRFTFDDFLRGMKTLGKFVLTGQVVSQKVAEARAMVCSRCVLNMSVPGCASCAGMANAVVAIKGAKSTKQDHLLRACGICKCANAAKVWLPIEIIAKSTTPEMLEQYKRVSECWQKSELEILIANGGSVG
jgi:hypothetical protein